MENKDKEPKKQLKQIAALSGIAIQMGLTIYLFVMLGKWLDATYNNSGKAFLIICTLVGVAIALYAVLKQINRLNP
ncbi:AtpZ/AtpI family protein [Seonamhaeicola marinus]|nr:AtpZ/AtpI family protein [Seonamhaeicola marinus]